MANHMSTTLTITNLDKQSFEKLKEIFNDGTNEYYTDMNHIIKQMYGEVDSNSLDWWSDNIGAKWLEIESAVDGEFEETIQLYMTSAWYVPTEFLEKLRDILIDVSTNVVLYGTYEDESLDPMGAFVYGYDYDDMEDLDIQVDFDKYWDEEDGGEYKESIYGEVLEHSESLYQAYLGIVKQRKEEE